MENNNNKDKNIKIPGNTSNIYSDSGRMNYGDGFSDDDTPEYVPVRSKREPMQQGAPGIRVKKKKGKGKVVLKIFIIILKIIPITIIEIL